MLDMYYTNAVSLGLQLHRERNSHQPIKVVYPVRLTGLRQAEGRMVVIDPAKAHISLFLEPSMLNYDFSQHIVFDKTADESPLPAGRTFKKAEGKTIREIIAGDTEGRIVFACCGPENGMWASNSLQVVDKRFYCRSKAGVNDTKLHKPQGIFPFFSFDQNRCGLTSLRIENGKVAGLLTFRNGISGPVIIQDGGKTDLVREARPNRGPNQIPWDPAKRQSAMSAVGKDYDGNLVFLALAGDPEAGNECNLQDVIHILLRAGCHEAILLGCSGDVQQFTALSAPEEQFIVGRPHKKSSMYMMFSSGRPLASAIIVRAHCLNQQIQGQRGKSLPR